MQAQFCALNAVAEGVRGHHRNDFREPFQHVLELQRMGADIQLEGNTAISHRHCQASEFGARLWLLTSRASAEPRAGRVWLRRAKTLVDRIYHVDRGYERIEEKLRQLGADVFAAYRVERCTP